MDAGVPGLLMDDPTGDIVSSRRGGRLGYPDWALKTRLIQDTWWKYQFAVRRGCCIRRVQELIGVRFCVVKRVVWDEV